MSFIRLAPHSFMRVIGVLTSALFKSLKLILKILQLVIAEVLQVNQAIAALPRRC